MPTTWHASIVHWRTPLEEIERAAAALAVQTVPCAMLHVLVGEADLETVGSVRALLEDVSLPSTVYHRSDNPGFAGGQNQLLAAAFSTGADAVLVHNPDVVLAREAAEQLIAATPPRALTGPVMELSEGGRPTGLTDSCGIRWTWDSRHLDVGQGKPLPMARSGLLPTQGVSGACIWLTEPVYREIVERTGELFDESFFAYREDAELALRAARLGILSYVVPAARARHDRRLRGTARGDAHVDRLGVRNRFLIAMKHRGHRPGRAPGPWVRDLIVLAAVLTVERSSLPGVRDAWRLRHEMRRKRLRLERSVASFP